MLRRLVIPLLLLCLAPLTARAGAGLSLYGAPKYAGASFTHFAYTNPEAPKGGTLRLAEVGSYDSLNPFIVQGDSANGVTQTFATLLEPSLDEPFAAYGYAAEDVTVAKDRKSVTFTLRPNITFHDGSPITAADVVWSFQTLKTKGAPFYRSYYGAVAGAQATDARHVTFTFANADSRELPLIVGQMPILSQTSFRGRDFAASTLTPLLGSGPYKVTDVQAGRSLTLERVANWWGADLPVNKGRFNFDHITYDFYRDPTVAFEAFVAGKTDLRVENVARNWAQAYDALPAFKDGTIVKHDLPNGLPAPVQGFVFNLRRPIFQDARVREALGYAFDFEWGNKNLAFNSYVRSCSFFDNTDMAATGLPSPDELKLLAPLRAQLDPRVFTTKYQPPKTDGSGDWRANMRAALALLKNAGWTLQDGALKNAKGEAFTFELVEGSPLLERWIQPFLRNLERLGIKVNYVVVDSAQYQRRLNAYDFDMTSGVWGQSLSPGNEQTEYWGSASADQPGGRNLAGLRDPAVDALIKDVVGAQDRASLLTATHALDRALAWNFIIIPHWHQTGTHVAVRSTIGLPETPARYGVAVDSWWAK